MLSVKARRTTSTVAVALLWVTLLGFCVWKIVPLSQELITTHQQVRANHEMLRQYLSKQRSEDAVIPSDGIISRYESLKRDMVNEASICADYYTRHNQSLERPVLKGYNPDPYEIANNFRELIPRLAQKTGNRDFLELGQLDDWAKEERGKPSREDIPALEKCAAIADVLVNDVLSVDPSTVVELMHVHNPPLPHPAAPEVPAVEWKVVRCRLFPVEITFTTRFEILARMLDRAVRTPAASSRLPCMAVQKLVLQVPHSSTGRVKMQLGLNVFDFYVAKGN